MCIGACDALGLAGEGPVVRHMARCTGEVGLFYYLKNTQVCGGY